MPLAIYNINSAEVAPLLLDAPELGDPHKIECAVENYAQILRNLLADVVLDVEVRVNHSHAGGLDSGVVIDQDVLADRECIAARIREIADTTLEHCAANGEW